MKWKVILLSVFLITTSLISLAAPQRSLDADNTENLWAHFPWIWTIGGGLFILLFLCVLRTKQASGNA